MVTNLYLDNVTHSETLYMVTNLYLGNVAHSEVYYMR
jgi:hypothetical protein